MLRRARSGGEGEQPSTTTRLVISPPGAVGPPPWGESDTAVETFRNTDGSVWGQSYERGEERWLRLPGIGSFRFGSSGGEAVVVAEPGVAADVLTDAYHRAVLPVALHAHGQEALHASAVMIAESVVAVCGPSQAGKSTTAFALQRRGHRVWADDAVVFDARTSSTFAIPYPHRLRIRRAAAEHFGLRDALDGSGESLQYEQAQTNPAPLACIFVLERRDEIVSAVEPVRLTATDAFIALIPNGYWFRLRNPERRRVTIERYLALSAEVPVFKIVLGASLEYLPKLLDSIEETVEAIGVGNRDAS